MLQVWYHQLYSILLEYEFVDSQFDPLLFIHCTLSLVVILFMYVDYLIVTDFDPSIIIDYVSILCFAFAYRDLVILNFFLGMKVVR